MDFPITGLMDEHACYQFLLDLLHPDGLACPRCHCRDRLVRHSRRRDSSIVNYRCAACRRIFNVFTGTPLQGTHRSPAEIILILRGFAQGTPTAQLARELKVSRPHLLDLRHKVQARAAAAADCSRLPDEAVEADEMYQNAGEKRGTAYQPGRPATAAGEQGGRPRYVEHRSAAASRRRGTQQPSVVPARGASQLGVGTGRPNRRAADQARHDGVHRRVGGI